MLYFFCNDLYDAKMCRKMLVDSCIEKFKQWLLSSEPSYFYWKDINNSFPVPSSAEQIKNDLIVCPKWILTELLNARKENAKLMKELKKCKEQSNVETTKAEELDFNMPKKVPKLKLIPKETKSPSKHKLRKVKSPRDDSPRDKTPRAMSTPENLTTFRLLESSPSDKDESRRLRGELMRKKYVQSITKKLTPKTPIIQTNEEEEENDIIDFEEAMHWMDETTLRVALSNLLLKYDPSVLNVIGKGIANGPSKERLAYMLITLYRSQNKHIEMLEGAIQQEINNAKTVNTLFRGEELPCRLLRVYIRLIGREYVQNVLGDLITEVSDNNYHYEIDPVRLEGSKLSIDQNFDALEKLTQRFLDKIFSSLYDIPPDFIRLCKFTCSNAAKKFDVTDQTVVAGFIFLRFICPAITSSESFGLPTIKTAEANRTLLLTGKIIQNLVNGSEFKEDYLFHMNQFLSKNELRMSTFCNKLKTYPISVDGDSECIIGLTGYIYEHKDRIVDLIDNDLDALKWTITLNTHLDKRIEVMTLNILSQSQLHDHPLLVKSFINMIMDNEVSITEIIKHIIAEPLSPQDTRNMAENLVTIFQSCGQVSFLSRVIVQNEIAESEYAFIHQSFTKAFFVAYTKRYCTTWLRSTIGDLLDNIIKQNISIEVAGHKAAENLKKLASVFMTAILASLSTSPKPLWHCMNQITVIMGVDPFKFSVLNFFALAIESPFIYKLSTEKPKKESANTLRLISDVLRNIANGSSSLISNCPMDTPLARKLSCELLDWAKSTSSLLDETYGTEPIEIIADAIKRVCTWLKDNLGQISTKLASHRTNHNIKFGVKEILSAMTENTPRKITTPRSNSDLMTELPKEVKKKRKKKKK